MNKSLDEQNQLYQNLIPKHTSEVTFGRRSRANTDLSNNPDFSNSSFGDRIGRMKPLGDGERRNSQG